MSVVASRLLTARFADIRSSERERFALGIAARLERRFVRFAVTPQQSEAWRVGAGWIWDAVNSSESPDDWLVIFEYSPPLVSRRPDALIVTPDSVLVIEMKTGALGGSANKAKTQVLRYARDLWAYVREAQGRRIVPVVLRNGRQAGETKPRPLPDAEPIEDAVEVVNTAGLVKLLDREPHAGEQGVGDPDRWLYAPRPTISQAAAAIVAAAQDPSVVTGLAEDDELLRLVNDLADHVTKAASSRERLLALVSGVPGAGKTLVGLRLAHDGALLERLPQGTEAPLYLTGNGPLVEVLCEVLARDEQARSGGPLSTARESAAARVKLVHGLTREGLRIAAPLVVFDEGQRVWDQERMTEKHRRPSSSEAEEILAQLEHLPWAVIVVLIGTGQNIHKGEAGAETWISALEARLALGQKWRAIGPPDIAATASAGSVVGADPALELRVVRRTDSAANLAGWADALLAGDLKRAAEIRDGFPDFPLFLTRDLARSKAWLRERKGRAASDFGLLASSRSARLSVYGVQVPGANDGFPWVQWFLDDLPNLNSRQTLEMAASEFKCQGLELDWTGLCWSWDLIWRDNSWHPRTLLARDALWRQRRSGHDFALNAYRVLLTRARKGMVIWVPPGEEGDPSRRPDEMDTVAAALQEAGATLLDT